MIGRRLLQSSVDIIPWRMRDTIRRIPLVRSLQRWLVKRYLSGRSFVHTISAGPARGVRFPLTLPQDKLIWTGTWEMDLAAAISDAVRPGDVCLDIGSYRGFFAGVMGVAGASRVYCFEPSPSNVAALERLKILNPALPIDVQPLAVGDRDGVEEFLIMEEATMGKLATSSFQAGTAGRDAVSVRVARLDTLVDSGGVAQPDLIKIDVEGAELDVLRGGDRTIAASRPRFFIEAHSPELAKACSAHLARLGYAVSVLETGGDVASAGAMEICHLVARHE